MNNGKRNFNKFSTLFWLLVAIDIAGIVSKTEIVHLIAKPLLMPALIAWLMSSTTLYNGKNIILAGLIFSWAGDVLLMFEKNGALFFIGGLVSFLLTHILYIIYFFRIKSAERSFLKTQPWWLLIVPAYGVGLVWLLYPHLAEMKLPVIIYALVICSMLLCSLLVFKKVSIPSRWYFVSGAILFVASDSLLAINKFYQPFAFAGSLIMITYCAAQFLIVKGVIERE